MSGKRLQLKRGTTAQTSTFTGLNGEVTVDTTKKTLVVHDGATVGGIVLAKDSALNSHTARTDNPHVVTKAQIGLGNADNTADSVKVVASAGKITTGRTISLSGDATGSVNFDGSANANIVVTIGNDTHTHSFVNLTEKPTTLAGYGITDATASSHVGSTGTAHGTVTTSVAGFMSNTDKTKLDGIAASANNYSLPVASASVLGGVKAGTNVSIDANGVISANDSSVAWSEVTSKPTTISGYGITDLNSSVQSIRATASQYGTAKMSLSGSTLTITTV